MRDCKAEGHYVALDDCEPDHLYADTGFLKCIQPSIIKIDGPFFAASGYLGDDEAVIRLNRAAHRLHLQAFVVIEHVSDEAALARAIRCGADLVQGFETGEPARLPVRFTLL